MCAVRGLGVLHLDELVFSLTYIVQVQEVMSPFSWSIQHAIYSI